MKGVLDHLLPFKAYAKVFLHQIHPDRHHGFPIIQKINASATSAVNELFKFKGSTCDITQQSHDLNFFIRKSSATEYLEISYKLKFNIPFDRISGKSALGLFKASGINVDFSILESFPKDHSCILLPEKTLNSHFMDGIKSSCFDLTHDDNSKFDIPDIRNFLHSRPYIQLEEASLNDISKVLRISYLLSHIIQRLETRLGTNMPLIIISNRFQQPEYKHDMVRLPLSANFNGNGAWFVLPK